MKTKIRKFIGSGTTNRNMVKIFSVLLVTASTIFTSVAQKSEERPIVEFTGLQAGGAISVYVSQGNANSLRIEADENILKDIKSEVKNGVLKIVNEHDYKWFSDERHIPVKVYVTIKDLTMIDLSGASNLKGETTIKTNKLRINLSGASNMNLILEANELNVDVSGASDMKISGTVQTIDADLSGASSFKAFDLESNTAKVMATGASRIEINTKDELTGHASGASSIVYKGTPQRSKLTESGASSVSRY